MARVYVGTYAKYNAGNLGGGWVDLDGCASYREFLAACKKLHRDEAEPEYMIQDCEGFPDGLSCMEWISEADFNDIKAAGLETDDEAKAVNFSIIDYSEKAIAVTGDTKPIADKLKAIGGRFNPRLSCGPGWIFSKKAEAEVRALLSGSDVKEVKGQKPAGNDDAARYAATVEEWIAAHVKGGADYYRKETAAAVKLHEGYYIIEKPRIENKFCFHDEGPDYETYKSLHKSEDNMRAYFMNANLSEWDDLIGRLADTEKPVYVHESGYQGKAYIRTSRYMFDYYDAQREGWRQISDEERKAIAAAVRFVRAGFEKRLQTYLKRYGTAKLHTWTYWADA